MLGAPCGSTTSLLFLILLYNQNIKKMVSTKSRMPSCGGLYAWLLFDFCPTEYLAHINMVKSRVYLIDLGGIYLYIHSSRILF